MQLRACEPCPIMATIDALDALEGHRLADTHALWERILVLRRRLYQAALRADSLTSDRVLEMSAELDRLILAYMESTRLPDVGVEEAST